MRGLRGAVLLLSVLLLCAVAGVVAVFMLQNDHWVLVRFPALQLDWSDPFAISEWETPLYAIMLACVAVGALLVLLLLSPLALRRMVQRNRDRRFINSLEGELSDLRNLPVEHPAPLEDIDEEPTPNKTADGKSGDRPDGDEAELMALLSEPRNSSAGGR